MFPRSTDGSLRLVVVGAEPGRPRTAYGLYRAAPTAMAPVVVYFYSLTGQLAGDITRLVERLGGMGLGAMAVEYPGYGLAAAEGPASEANIYADAHALLRHLTEGLGVASSRIVLMGASLGTGVAAEMAVRGYGGRLVLLAPYTSIPDVASSVLPMVPSTVSRRLIADRFDTASKAPRIDLPTLIVHGTADRVVPFRMGRRLARLFPRAQLVALRGASHFLLQLQGGRLVLQLLARFLASGGDITPDQAAGADDEDRDMLAGLLNPAYRSILRTDALDPLPDW